MNARLLVDTQHDAILIPTAAIQRNAQGAFVYVDQAGPDRFDSQHHGGHHGRRTPPRCRACKPGEIIAVDGFDKLQDGVKVAVHEPSAKAGTGQRRSAGNNGTPAGTASSMNPSRPFILRPVATSLLMAAILLAGFVAFLQLPVSALPEVDYPTIQVVTFYPGRESRRDGLGGHRAARAAVRRRCPA